MPERSALPMAYEMHWTKHGLWQETCEGLALARPRLNGTHCRFEGFLKRAECGNVSQCNPFLHAVLVLCRTVNKKTVLENLDLVLLCLDEIVDGG